MAFKAVNRQSSGGGMATQLNPQEVKQKKKERILTTLTRLNDRDTQRFAADELLMIIRELDSETFPILLNCLCSTGPDQKMYARRECARALGFLTADACPTRFLALQNPALNKLLLQLKKGMSDSDAGVRDACTEALGVIAMALAEAEGQLLVGSTGNPVVKVIFDALSIQSKETQACASQALLAIAPSLGTLEKDVMSLIMKMLKSPSFMSTNALLTAFASCDPELHLPVGLIQNTVDYILPSLSTVLGHSSQASGAGVPAGSSGVLGCFGHKDWQVRKAAADSVRALALLLGPHMEAVDPIWDETNPLSLCGRCIRTLEACKFDKVKPVRDVVQDTLTILYELMEHGRANGGMDEWVQAVEERSHVKATLPSSHSVSYSTSRPPSRQGGSGGLAAGVRTSSMIEGFKNHTIEDVVVAAPRSKSMMPTFGQRSINSQEALEEINGGLEESEDMDHEDFQMQDSDDMVTPTAVADSGEYADVVAVPQANGQAGPTELPAPQPDYSPVRTTDPASEQPAGEGMVQISAREWERVQSDLATLYQSHQQLLQMVLRLTEDSNTAISGLQGRVSSLEQASVAPTALNPITTTRAPSPLRSASSPLPPPSPSAPASHPTPHSPPVNPLRSSTEPPTRTSRLRTSSSSLQDEEGLQTFSPSSPVHHQAVTPTRRSSSPALNTSSAQNSPAACPTPHTPAASPTPHTPEYTTPLSSERNISPWRERTGTGDLDGAYAEALRSQGGSPNTELKLARLLQKTGPVWGELSHETAIMLLQTFNNLIETGAMLPRIMPWLWRLADENCAPVDVPQQLKAKLLLALSTCQATLNEDVQTQERVKLLRSTLMTVWGMKEVPRASPISSPGGSRSMRVRSSLEGLATLQGQLNDMQRSFRSGCQSPTSPASEDADMMH